MWVFSPSLQPDIWLSRSKATQYFIIKTQINVLVSESSNSQHGSMFYKSFALSIVGLAAKVLRGKCISEPIGLCTASARLSLFTLDCALQTKNRRLTHLLSDYWVWHGQMHLSDWYNAQHTVKQWYGRVNWVLFFWESETSVWAIPNPHMP